MTLQLLISKLSEAGGGSRELDAEIALQVAGWTFEKRGSERKAWWRGPGQTWASTYNNTPPQFSKSLDAALSLVEQKLPGWEIVISVLHDGGAADLLSDDGYECSATHSTPALALCLALLKALEATPHPPEGREG